MEFAVKYERDRDGWWFASIPEIQGCHTQGSSLPQARERIRECLALYVSSSEAASATLVDQIELPPHISDALQKISAYGIHGVDVDILLESRLG